MAAGDNYRAKAVELLALAQTQIDPVIRADFEHLAAAYLRLAEQVKRNKTFSWTPPGNIPPEVPPDPKPKP